MHGAALAGLARANPRYRDWTYSAFDVLPERLGDALALLLERGFLGVNLTVPHKVLAVPLVSAVDPGAREAGAVNTLLAGEGGWRGFNTDGYGLAAGIREDLGRGLSGAPVVLLGAGGAARGAAAECLRSGCAGLWVINRSRATLDAFLRDVEPAARGIPVVGLGPGDSRAGLPRGALLINATSLGLKPGDPAPADLRGLPEVAAVYDMIYNPPETGLLRDARRIGLPASNGLGMLVHQGARALEIWTGEPAAATAPVMRAAAAKALGSPGPSDPQSLP
jgi:shikimate dehydrogenase